MRHYYDQSIERHELQPYVLTQRIFNCDVKSMGGFSRTKKKVEFEMKREMIHRIIDKLDTAETIVVRFKFEFRRVRPLLAFASSQVKHLLPEEPDYEFVLICDVSTVPLPSSSYSLRRYSPPEFRTVTFTKEVAKPVNSYAFDELATGFFSKLWSAIKETAADQPYDGPTGRDISI